MDKNKRRDKAIYNHSPSNSPQTYYLLYFTTSLQKIPLYNSFSPTIPPYLFPLYTITN